MKNCWHLKNFDISLIEKLQRFFEEVWDDTIFKIYYVRKTSPVFKMSSGRKKLALEFDNFFTKYKEKRTPYDILNETQENKKWFFIGFYAADGFKRNKRNFLSLHQKTKITMSTINFLCQSLRLQTSIKTKDDKFNTFVSNIVKKQSDEKIHKIEN